MNDAPTFGDLLRRHRVAASLSQEALAERARISSSAIAALERGRRTAPRLDTVALLADALELVPPERERFIATAIGARPELQSDAPASEAARLYRLPIPPTVAVGRERDVAEIGSLLAHGTRLLTLTGPGGVGKTRLALQVASALQPSYADGSAFVDLSSVRDPQHVAGTMVQQLGLNEKGKKHDLELLLAQLRERQLLLIVDNFEQIIEAAPLVADVMSSCPRLAVVVTSRSPLNVRGEQQFPVAPLAVPDGEISTTAELAQCESVRLFIVRAQAVQSSFELTDENAHAVAEICRKLDGLPLAIELAAARIRLLPPAALLARLDRRLATLTAGARDLPVRQQTLRDTVAWSYDLLDGGEQRVFRHLAVFTGGFTVPSTRAIVDEDADDAVLDSVASLLDKSLLRLADGSSETEPRFTMLETIREYARERLDECGEAEPVRERHARYFLSLAEEADPYLRSGDRNAWLARLVRDWPNLRAVLEWSGDKPERAELGLRLATALTWFWRFHEWFHEGRSWLEALLARTSATDHTLLRGRALYGAGMLAWYQGDLETAAERTEAAISVLENTDDPEWIATTLRLLGLIRLGQHNPAAAVPLLERSRGLFRQLGDTWGEAMALYRLGLAASELRDTAAETYYDQSLELFRSVGDPLGVSVVLNAQAVAAATRGDDAAALTAIMQGLELARRATDRWDLARLLNNAGALWLRHGDYRQAEALFAESLRTWQEIEYEAGIALSLAGFGGVAVARRDAPRAGRMLSAARRMYPTADSLVSAASSADLDQQIEEARQILDPSGLQDGWLEGQNSSIDQIIAEALAG